MWLLGSSGNAINPALEYLFSTLTEMEAYLLKQPDNLGKSYSFRFVPKWEPPEPSRNKATDDEKKSNRIFPEPLSR
jgi:hypothetical protein